MLHEPAIWTRCSPLASLSSPTREYSQANSGVDGSARMIHDGGTKARDAGAAHAEWLATGSAPWPDDDHSRLRCICSPSMYLRHLGGREEKKLALSQRTSQKVDVVRPYQTYM